MYITFDYKCPSCGHTEPRFVRRSEMDDQVHRACAPPLSGGIPMTRLPAGTRTTFRYADRKLKG
jgi:hypothetical protein